MVKFSEVETKYDASKIDLGRFIESCLVLGEPRRQDISSYDHYYTGGDKTMRHREGFPPELTMKHKTAQNNNYRRVEVNVKLGDEPQNEAVKQLCSMLSLTHNFSIYKDSKIFWFPKFNTVYYTVYSDHTRSKELGRFIEIEMDEHYAWKDTNEAWELLLIIEKQLASLGIRPQSRIKKSLFEMYTKQ